MNLTARQLYFEAVRVGDELPPLVKPPVDRVQIARYAGAAGDFNPLHLDEPHARAAGYPSVFAPGTLAMGFLGELVSDWTRGARLRRFQARFVKMVWPGDVITARGRVGDRRFEPGGRYAIDVETWAENQRGELVTRGVATFQLYYSAEDEARQQAGQPPLLVTAQEEEARLARLSRAQPARPPVPPRALAPPRPLAPPASEPAAQGPQRPGAAAVPGAATARPPSPPGGVHPSPPRPVSSPARAAAPRPPARPAPRRAATAKAGGKKVGAAKAGGKKAATGKSTAPRAARRPGPAHRGAARPPARKAKRR